ncbi:MAG TPA: DUF3299 domain-containing protein [Usitatibacteraceae bacterium]|nr:DUF3299 domain-containing protein [Usitatibacteraceae bacterium]
MARGFGIALRGTGWLVAFLWAALACAQPAKGPAAAGAASTPAIADDQLLSYLPKDGLPAGTVAWLTFRQVKLVEERKDGKTMLRPEFGSALKALDNKPVKLYGFVLPLSTTTKQKHFLLSPLPTHCPFCVSQGPDSMVEVLARIPVEFNQWDPVLVAGKLELVNDSSLYYRLVDAEPVKP